MNQTVQRLEGDNQSLQKAKEDLEHKLTQKATDIRNVQYDLKHHRDDVNKREILLQEGISKNENELLREREMFKNLNNHHVALKKQLEQLSRERDDNEVLIRTLRDKEHGLGERLKQVTDELNRSEGSQIKVELKCHVENRRRHLDEIRALLDNLSGHLGKVNAQEEYKVNESDFNYHQSRVDDLDAEIKLKEDRLNGLNNEN
jgi:chromosome segregation ATPase